MSEELHEPALSPGEWQTQSFSWVHRLTGHQAARVSDDGELWLIGESCEIKVPAERLRSLAALALGAAGALTGEDAAAVASAAGRGSPDERERLEDLASRLEALVEP